MFEVKKTFLVNKDVSLESVNNGMDYLHKISKAYLVDKGVIYIKDTDFLGKIDIIALNRQEYILKETKQSSNENYDEIEKMLTDIKKALLD